MFKFETVRPPYSPAMLEETRRLFLEYARSLKLDLEFQGFARELLELPGEYAPPRGVLILARPEGRPTAPPSAEPGGSGGQGGEEAVGCIALRPLEGEVCEMKRLYVRPACRGLGLGRTLSLRLMAQAARLGYRSMRLDTLASMEAATGLYRSLGFREIPPYYHNPLPEPLFFEKELRP